MYSKGYNRPMNAAWVLWFFSTAKLFGGIIAAIRFDGQVAVQNIKPLGIREAVRLNMSKRVDVEKRLCDDEVMNSCCFFQMFFV